MITTDFIYIFLNLMMLAIFVFAGVSISYNKSNYWEYAIWPVIAFTLVLGLRLNRGNDYVHYMHVYIYDLEKNQVFFTALNHMLKFIGTGPHWIFIWYSGAFILGAMFFLKTIRQYANWVLPLFLISFTVFSEYMIRQAFGYTFVFLFMMFMFDEDMVKFKRWVCMLVCFYLSYSIHSVNAITCILNAGLYYFIRKPFSPFFSIPLYIFASYYIQQNFDFSYLNGLLSFLGEHSDKYASYTDNAGMWFSEDAIQEGFKRKPLVKVFQTLGDSSLIYLGYKVLCLNKDHKMTFLYNTFVCGAIFSQSFYTIELLRRMGDSMYWYWAFPLAYVLCNKECVMSRFRMKVIGQVMMSFLLFYSYDYLKYLLLRENNMFHFLWDL